MPVYTVFPLNEIEIQKSLTDIEFFLGRLEFSSFKLLYYLFCFCFRRNFVNLVVAVTKPINMFRQFVSSFGHL